MWSNATDNVFVDPATTTTSTTVSPCEVCGWAAAFVSMLAFGSFGVPIKSQAAISVDIDPLVFQSYKTFMCLATSWIVIVLGEEVTFSPWGIVSGLFWVPGGVATIIAVKAAGLAIGIGIGSSFIVLVSFVWGIFIFDERVHSRVGACVAIACMMMGLIGMSYFSSPETDKEEEDGRGREGVMIIGNDGENGVAIERDVEQTPEHDRIQYSGLINNESDDEGDGPRRMNGTVDMSSSEPALSTGLGNSLTLSERTAADSDCSSAENDSVLVSTTSREDMDMLDIHDDATGDDPSLVSSTSVGRIMDEHFHNTSISSNATEHVVICGVKLTKRQGGMLAAAFCGLWGGSIMVPMKWAPSDAKGTHYLISFAIGASIVTLSLWIIRYLYHVVRLRSLTKAYRQLPSFHLRVMWKPGGISGLLWSIGNFFSLYSVLYLGEGVGMYCLIALYAGRGC